MNRYGHVIFEKGGVYGAEQQKKLALRLRALGVIEISDDKLEKWYKEDCQNPCGSINHYVLHGRKEAEAFRTVMKSEEMQTGDIYWEIGLTSKNRRFDNWLKKLKVKKRREKHGKRKEVRPVPETV